MGLLNLTEMIRLLKKHFLQVLALSLAVGVIGALILGVGMCCTMVWQGVWFIPGIFIGLAGIAVAACAYPVYKAVLRAERKRVAPQVLRICEELEGKKPQA